ncbi:MAG: PAS domain-containing protein [Eubacteriales bacterium]
MELSVFFKSVIDQDAASVVLCDLNHTILYMNPAAVRSYAKRGGESLIGKSLLDCHNPHSQELIRKPVAWFGESPANNRVFEFHHEKDNRDVYTIALRDDAGRLIGYYEKHEYRNPETAQPFSFGQTMTE